MKRRGVSGVVTTILFVLLALGAVLLVWGVVRGIIGDTAEDISAEQQQVGLDISIPGKTVLVDAAAEEVSLIIERGVGGGEVVGFSVILEDGNGDTYVRRVEGVLEELSGKKFIVDYEGVDIDLIKKISIAPIFLLDDGTEFIGSILAVYTLNRDNIAKASPAGSFSLDLGTARDNGIIFPYELTELMSTKTGVRDGNQPFTISFWKKKRAAPANDVLFSFTDAFLDGIVIVDEVGGKVHFRINGPITWTTDALNLDEWYHIVAVRDTSISPSKNILYINGVVNSSVDSSTWVNVVTSPSLGYQGRTSSFSIDGFIDEFMVFSRALSAGEIDQLYVSDYSIDLTGLEGWYRFEEGEGTVAVDSSGNGRDGVITDGVVWA